MLAIDLDDLLPHGYVDAHHHVWAPERLGDQIGYGWLRDIGAPKPFGDPTPIQRDYRIEEFLAEAPLKPVASVHVQADGALPDPVAETAFVQAEFDRVGHVGRIIGLADLSAPDLQDILDRHAAYPAFSGVRQIVARLEDRPDLSFAARDYLRDPAWRDGLKVLETRDLSFDLQMYPHQAAWALDALQAVPDLRVIIDHALCPYDRTFSGMREWGQAVEDMAKRPYTFIKWSGWGMYMPDWAADNAREIHDMLEFILSHFGPERTMWGSNYPVEKLVTPYAEALFASANAVGDHNSDDIFLRSAATAYKMNLT